MRNGEWLLGMTVAAMLGGPVAVAQGEETVGAAQAAPEKPATPAEAKPAEPKAAGEKPATKPFTAGYKNGFWIQSEDEAFKLRVGGYVQGDGRFHTGDDAKLGVDAFVMRRVRPSLQGTVAKYVDFYVLSDFGGGTAVVQDAYADFHPSNAFRIRAGKLKEPVGLERLQSGQNILFVERSLPTAIVPNRDLGIQIHGDLAGGVVNYAVGIFNGVVDGGSGDTDTNDGKDLAGRVFFQPFRKSASKAAKGLGIGVSGTTGKQEGALPSYRSVGQFVFFSYATGVTAAGTRTRVSPQGYYYVGPFGLLAEYAQSSQEVKKGTAQERISNKAYGVAVSFVLTGEEASYAGVKAKKPFDPKKGSWGAFEVAARLEGLEVDQDAFRLTFAETARSARKARGLTLGLNWHVNSNLKYVVNYGHTSFTGGAASGGRPTEKTVQIRTQVSF